MSLLSKLTNPALQVCTWASLLSFIVCFVWFCDQFFNTRWEEADEITPLLFMAASLVTFVGFAATLKVLELLERIAISSQWPHDPPETR